MQNWFLVKLEDISDTVQDISYCVPEVFCTIGRVIGFAFMFGAGFFIGQVLRGIINALLIIAGIG